MEQTKEMKEADKFNKTIHKRMKEALNKRDAKLVNATILAVVKWMRESGYEEDAITELKDTFGVVE